MKMQRTASLATSLTLGSILLAVSSTTLADTILGVYAGVGAWNAGTSGDIGDKGSNSLDAEQLGMDDSMNNVFYVALEHPVPMIPNIRLAIADVSTTGEATLKQDFNFGGETFPLATNTRSELDLSHTDATLYWEVLDNWVSLDVGLTARMLDGKASLSSEDGNLMETYDINVALPMLYGKAQFDLPFSGWYLGGSANILSFGDNSFSDMQAGIGYQSDGLLLDFGFDVGYRTMSLVIEDIDNLETDLAITGPFAAFTVHF